MSHRPLIGTAFAAALTLATAAGPATAAGAAAPVGGMRQSAALAISGGASMGAYEAGLNWATIGLIRSGARARRLAAGGNIMAFDLASVAGTSAGGINTLLSGLAWCVRPERDGGFPNRIDDNVFRDTWLAPDINNLLPADPDAPPYLPDDAALSRRAFLDVAGTLREKWSRPGTFRDGCMVPLGVTVTRTVPAQLVVDDIRVANQRFYLPFEIHARPDGSAAFSFDPAAYPKLVDPSLILFPRRPDEPEHAVSDDQVIEAIFATSAFPTGFGRRRIAYCQLTAFFGDGPSPAAPLRDGLVCPQGYELAEGEFADGGLFDNLPLGLARKLAEERSRSRELPLPVEYIYVDPNRLRFHRPERHLTNACEGASPPAACRTMEFSMGSELSVLGGFLGTARKYALYDELSREAWRLNLTGLSERVADLLDAADRDVACPALLRFFDGTVGCAQAVRRAGRFLDLAYDHGTVPVIEPLSSRALLDAGLATDCRPLSMEGASERSAECTIDRTAYRRALAAALVEVARASGPEGRDLVPTIERSAQSLYNDRTILVTSLGAPITGQLLGAFGAFLDHKFRQYDYYVGVYDAIAIASREQCTLRFPPTEQQGQYLRCMDLLGGQFYENLDVASDPRARYVFARLAQREFGDLGVFAFAYTPMPPEDRDMRVIHEALEEVLLKSPADPGDDPDELFMERVFFDHLKAAGFVPTPDPAGGTPLLALIIDDPENWTYELTKRWTTRLVRLEQEAERVFEQREPDPEKRPVARTWLLGAGAWVMQTATYKYPEFSFAPSTAPGSWVWRNVIPYELAFDLVDGDLLTFWQPTWSVRRKANLGVRLGFGFAGGLLRTTAGREKNNYGTAGLDLTVLTRSPLLSSYGVTPAVYHAWTAPESADQTTLGVDVHVGTLKDRFRVGVGVRDLSSPGGTWFLTLGIADLPGMLYWMTR